MMLVRVPRQSQLFECGENCRCVKSGRTDCGLFITKNEALGVEVEVRYTRDKGWAVFAKEKVVKGSYVATYIGEVRPGHSLPEHWGSV
jgi:hypothetical protein